MTGRRNVTLILGLLLLPAVAAAWDVTPETVHVYLPDGEDSVSNYNFSGEFTSGGVGAIWEVTDRAGTCNLNGLFTGSTNPRFSIIWRGIADTMPLSLTVTSSGTGEYNLVTSMTAYDSEIQDSSLSQWFVVGDTNWAQNIPPVQEFYITVSLESANIDYDLTLIVDWGPGVASEPSTWGQVKSLYQ